MDACYRVKQSQVIPKATRSLLDRPGEVPIKIQSVEKGKTSYTPIHARYNFVILSNITYIIIHI